MTSVAASPEVIALSKQRLRSGFVDYRVADLFDWQPDRYLDFSVVGVWLSHVPRSRFISFCIMVERCLTLGGRVFFVDNPTHRMKRILAGLRPNKALAVAEGDCKTVGSLRSSRSSTDLMNVKANCGL